MYIYNCSYTYVEYTYICIYVPNESIEDLNDSKTLLSFWLRSLNCVYHEIPATSCGRLIEIETTYDPDRTGIKTRTYHRDPDYTNAEQEPYTNTQPYDNRPNYGAGSLRLSPSNSHQHQHYDQPPYGQQHQNQYQQQRPQPQPSQQQYENPQQADGFQQRDLPLYNRNAHVRHSPSARQTERTERRRESARSEVENTLTDYNSGCPPQHTGPVPYPYDCRRFVNCWHGRGHIQSCGPGTVFNPETLECDRPDKVVCSNPNVNGALRDERRETQATVQSAPQQNKYRAGRLIDASTDNVNALCPQGLTGLAPHPNDCTKFLNCANGNTHVQDCGPGTAFSATKKVCDFKENVDCSGRENAAYGTLNTRDGRQHANLYNVDKNIDYENSVSKDEIEGDIFCPPSVSGHFPYPFDYTKFINCKNGKTAIQNCLPGTVYSISKNYCEPEENVPHIDRVAYIVSEVRYEYSVTIVSCPPSTDGLHLYPYDFMKHISCRQGHMWIITCPANTVFSITGKSCRPESLVSVGDRVRSAWELQYSSEYSESRSAALNSLDETFVCPYGQSGLYPHPFDCRKYLKCLNGQLSVETCRQGEVFSLSSKHCDPKELVGVKEQVPAQFDVGQISTSESSYGYSTSNEGSIQLICPPHVNAFFLHPFDCTKYLYCRDGQGEVESCNSGKVFSISRRECVNRNQVDAYDRVEYESEVSHEFSTELEPSTNHAYEPNCAAGANSLYPHPTDSTKYIKCVGGQATIEHCIPGMIFSKIRKYCDYESRVQEYDSEAGNGYNVLGGTDEDGAATVTFSGGKSSTVSHRTNVECPPNSAGMHPHPYDCHKFLQCDNGVTHIKECGPGTAWSVEMEVCDFGKNVNCSGRIGSRTTSSGIHVDQKVACPANVEGFYLHPFNGYQYIECKNGGETQVQACPPGSVFSISRQMCLAEDKVNANDHAVCMQEYSTTDINVHYDFVVCPALAMGYFIYPFDGLLFIKCHAGHTMIESCEPNTFFSITNKICIPTSGVGSSDRVWLNTGEQRVSDSYGAYNHNREWSLVDTAEVATPTQSFVPSPQYNPECPSSATGLYPHPSDCTKFLRCANGITHIMDCGPGTAFNIALEVCDFIDKVDCTGRVAGYNNEAAGFDGDVQSESVACPEGASGMFSHPLDCTKFLNCNNGITNVQDCGPGTAWNAKLEVCDFIKNVDCSKNSGRNPNAPTAQGGHEHNPNTNYQSPPLPQTNYGDQLQNNWNYRGEQQSYGSSTQHRPSHGRQNYGDNLPTTSTRTPKYGDRWSNMDMQRPIPSEQTYDGRYNPDYERQQRLPNYGKELLPNRGANSWVGTGSAIDRQTPTQSIIYEEGSLQPNRNYNTFSTYTTPLAPFNPGSALTNETKHVYYAQPVGSEENTEEVFDDGKVMPQPPNSLPFNNPNEKDYVQSPSSNWVPIPNQVLLPPKRTDEPHGDRNDFPSQNIFTPAAYITPPPRPTHTSNYPVITPTVPSQPNFDASNLFGGLQPPPPPTTSPRPFNSISPPDNSFVLPNAIKGRPTGRSIDEVEPIRAFSTNAQGRPHLLSPPSNINAYTTDISMTTPATYLQPPALPTPAASTRLRPVHNLLENTTVATFSKDPHYSGSYSNVAHAHRPKSIDTGDVQTPENVLMADALRLLLRPYFNRSGTISDENAEQAESHIMKLSPHLPTHTAESTTLPSSSSRVPKDGAENEKEVELILAGEQHSLTTIPIQNTTHETRTEFYSKNTKQESKPNTNWHNHGHSREFHRNHPNLLNPFNEDERPSPHTHHRHKHNRAYHQRHPELPNPFENPEAPTTKTNYDLSNTNLLNPYAESTTPFSVRPPQIDLRVGNVDCPFDCGNGKCVRSHEVCNGINNCGNRKDEDECKHLGYEVRLTGGDNPNMGRVEVKILGKWGYVCDDKFGLRDAEVVCRELGFNLGASEVRGFSYYPPTTADVSFAMDEVECRGNETSLRECDFKGWGVSNCGPDEVVGVVCKVPQLRCPNNYWLCSTSQECIPPAFVCDNTPDCADKSDESESVCNSPIKYRLQGGRSPSEGRLEVRYRGEWGSVCDDDFGIKEAQVMCNSMGFYGTPTLAKNTYGPGSGPIWLDQVSCFGNETTLDQCNHWTWGEHNCNHTEDVGLKCTVGALPRKVTATQQSDESTQQELDETQQQLEDIGLFSEQWERKSKAVGEHRRCGQFKDILIDEYAHPEERVVNGSVAKRGHHPWQATIRTRGRGGISSHWCGAVLISSRHLLTAAHCLAGYPKGAYLVRMGDHYANIAESSEVDSFIENWYVHEKFRDATHMNNDIAVVVLKTPVKFNDYIQPVCLPNKGAALAENRMCTISGWGSIKSGVSTPSNILRAAELPILSDEVCRQKHVYGGSMTEGMFCAGYMDESVDACDGDSGGPLICHDDDGETLYGIISWGQHCGYANKPGVYVRVEKYVDWILEKIKFSMQKGS
ncbi:uncharacterized protein LOC101463243 isoform X2 [Ceratitis capitata]|uniref:uncharacterized protein LOC101463243 isoform X2 n=1 Tax=Ceratitis capitata TaxID=7213 RepID=UPI000A0F4090|nr:uncharacterized protein LOC101463243 isoform X2 [Ceratitis capitata]